MSAYDKKYISQNAGLSYNAFLRHFQDQAKGSASIRLLGKSSPTRGLKSKFATPLCHEGFILVDTADKNISNKKGEVILRLEIVDPNELARRRALEDLSQQEQDKKTATEGTKTIKKRKRAHSSSNDRKTRVTNASNKKAATAVRKLVKK